MNDVLNIPGGSVFLLLIGLGGFWLAFKTYSRFIARSFDLNDEQRTPAHGLADGMDYVPTPRHILWGHHFTSIAGAAPIVGPAIAVIWGWLPSFLWVVVGTIFMGAVHDFGCLALSAKKGARSVADLTGQIIGPKSRILFLVFVMFLTWIVLAVFAVVIAALFVQNPSTVIPVNLEIAAAMVIGFLITKKKISAWWPSLVVLLLLYASIVWSAGLGSDGLSRGAALLPEFLKGSDAQFTWVVMLLIYAGVASMLPVWLLLQPRDFINSHQLVVGLSAMMMGVLIQAPPVVAPALNTHPEGAMPLFPFLFITIACGAISGFHGLVGSGTTSKQLNRFSDARVIGYGGMLGEGSLALMAVLACTAGFAHPGLWHSHYGDWKTANMLGSKVGAFVQGGAGFLEYTALSSGICQAVVAVLVISFAATTLDSACRIQRFILKELTQDTPLRFLSQRLVASVIACLSPLLLVMDKTWTKLWPLFGASNQMLAALSLCTISAWLLQQKKNCLPFLIPAIFVSVITFLSLGLKVYQEVMRIRSGQDQPVVWILGSGLLLIGLWIIVMAGRKMKQA